MNHDLPEQHEFVPEPTKKTDWRSVSLSLVFHVVLLLLLVIFFTNQNGGGDGGESLRSVDVVLTSADELNQDFEYQEQSESESDVTSSSQSQPIEALPNEQPPSMPDIAASQLPGMEFQPQEQIDASQMTVVPQNTNPHEKYELTAEDLKFIAREQAELRRKMPRGQPAETQIFGSGQLRGRRFVFVIDRSKSMGDSGLGVLDKARKELTAALESLKPEHQFQVIAYHQSTAMIGQRQMLSATAKNKLRVPTFIQTLVAFGATRHENGLTAALSFQPDVVVLITDGGLPILNEGQIATMVQMTRGRTQIHCVQFGSGVNQERDNFMMRLADKTDGSYRYIDVNQWDD